MVTFNFQLCTEDNTTLINELIISKVEVIEKQKKDDKNWLLNTLRLQE